MFVQMIEIKLMKIIQNNYIQQFAIARKLCTFYFKFNTYVISSR